VSDWDAAGKGTARILLVSDERSFRRLIEIAVRMAGYEAVSANDKGAALEFLEAQGPDLLLLDLAQEELDDDFLVEARALGFRGPAIIISTYERRRAYSADAWLKKPFDPIELVSLIDKLTKS